MLGSPFITIPTIVVHPEVLRCFRARAWKKYPKEYIEYLWGWREGKTLYIVTTVNVKHDATNTQVLIDSEHEESLHEEASELKLSVVGSIHTHPVLARDPKWLRECNRLLSITDHYCGAASKNEYVSAVVSMWKTDGHRRSATHFWIPQGPIIPVFKYEKDKRKLKAIKASRTALQITHSR